MTRKDRDRVARKIRDAAPREQFWWLQDKSIYGGSGKVYNKAQEMARRMRQR